MQNAKGHVAIILVQGRQNQGGKGARKARVQGVGWPGGPGVWGDRGPEGQAKAPQIDKPSAVPVAIILV